MYNLSHLNLPNSCPFFKTQPKCHLFHEAFLDHCSTQWSSYELVRNSDYASVVLCFLRGRVSPLFTVGGSFGKAHKVKGVKIQWQWHCLGWMRSSLQLTRGPCHGMSNIFLMFLSPLKWFSILLSSSLKRNDFHASDMNVELTDRNKKNRKY